MYYVSLEKLDIYCIHYMHSSSFCLMATFSGIILLSQLLIKYTLILLRKLCTSTLEKLFLHKLATQEVWINIQTTALFCSV